MQVNKKIISFYIGIIILTSIFIFFKYNNKMAVINSKICEPEATPTSTCSTDGNTFIKWAEFNISYDALCKAYNFDVESYGKEVHINWIELLAYIGTKNGGKFPNSSINELSNTANDILEGKTTIEDLSKDMKYYNYYYQIYSAVLGGFVGEYEIQVGSDDKESTWEKKYGLKAFSPIAMKFDYNDFDDFGVARSYGYCRPHLGHDMMGQTGTPIIAIESGYVEILGWNQYGGWRIGIRSFDKKRYYYYAHLRQNFPFCKDLKEGDAVTAGDVIGYLGHTGYSAKENVNNIETPHLHWGLQLIFDESQKECNNEIWIDCYDITRFLQKNRSETIKNEETKEWHRVYEMKDPVVEEYEKKDK